MEGQKQQKKLSYEELSKRFGELYAQYQKATDYIQKLQAALNEDSFNQTSFFISMLFKVMENPAMYTDEFVKWCVENIESALRSFAAVGLESDNEKVKEVVEEDKQNEAE